MSVFAGRVYVQGQNYVMILFNLLSFHYKVCKAIVIANCKINVIDNNKHVIKLTWLFYGVLIYCKNASHKI